MVKVITQETYDEIVLENMKEFDMTPAEAIEEAVQQFEAQGVDLSNIIKDLAMTSEEATHVLKQTVTELEQLMGEKSLRVEEVNKKLDIIRDECNKDIAHRVYANRQQLYPLLISLMESKFDNEEIIRKCLQTIGAFMCGQPDPLDERGIALMIRLLDHYKSVDVQVLIFKWIRECCVKHELNRQHIFNANVLDHLKAILDDHTTPSILRDVCGVLRALVLDDDIRVDYGRAHEHARVIASDTICPILKLLEKYKTDEALVSDLMLTLAAILVRNEFCKKVEDAGGIEFILQAMLTFHDSEKLNRQGLKLLKVLAGNDDCKMDIIKKGAAPIIVSAIEKHKQSDSIAVAGLACISALALRSPDNSESLYKAGCPTLIIETMKLHPDNFQVQKNASWAIRNMVCRNKNQCKHFLDLGVEKELNKALTKFGQSCDYDIKSALRDLGCKVELIEQWTGKGGKIQSSHRF